MRTDTQRIFVDDYLLTWMEGFLVDRKARGVAPGTLRFYKAKLRLFAGFCEGQAVTSISQITAGLLREYLIYLERGHNAGGRHAAYRTVRAFLYWYEAEVEGWRSPTRKVRAPKVRTEVLEPVPLDVLSQMVRVCNARDAAILLCLLDTGARASELLALNVEDVDLVKGEVLIRNGKGGKPRSVYLGRQSRRALRRYLSHASGPLWLTRGGERLSYDGLRAILIRRAGQAGVSPPSAHAFRRTFALSMLRNGTDVFTLAKLMGHEGIGVLQRYLKQTNADTERARYSPADERPDWLGRVSGG